MTCTRQPASRSCYELIRGSGQCIYSRKDGECARVHVNLQNRNTRVRTGTWCASLSIGSHIEAWLPTAHFARAYIWRQNARSHGSVHTVQLL